MSQPQGARIPARRLDPPYGQKAMPHLTMFPDRLLEPITHSPSLKLSKSGENIGTTVVSIRIHILCIAASSCVAFHSRAPACAKAEFLLPWYLRCGGLA